MSPFELSQDAILLFVQQYLFVLTRIAAMFMVMPIIGSNLVTARVKVALAVAVTVIVVPILPAIKPVTEFTLQTILVLFQEMLLGVIVGFVFQVVFQVFVIAGQIIAMQMGLGFASMNDPVNGANTTALSQFYTLLITLMFVSVNGHLVLLTLLVESFTVFVPGEFTLSASQLMAIAQLGTWLFSASLLMALPVMTSLLFVNMAFGIMSRAAPQLNIFSLGFPFTLVCGLALIWFGLFSFVEKFDDVMTYGFLFVHDFLE